VSLTTISTLFAVGAIAIGLVVLALIALRLAAIASDTASRWWETTAVSIAPYALWIAFAAALIATTGSLYYSEIANFAPCEFCWYQRIAMYPLTVVLGVAAWRRDHDVWLTALPIAAVGAVLSAYHYLLQRFPELSTGSCSADLPCSAAYIWEFDFVSIPFMALVLFASIIGLLLIDRSRGGTEV
jgi:disulfide bond formation protein DsbB